MNAPSHCRNAANELNRLFLTIAQLSLKITQRVVNDEQFWWIGDDVPTEISRGSYVDYGLNVLRQLSHRLGVFQYRQDVLLLQQRRFVILQQRDGELEKNSQAVKQEAVPDAEQHLEGEELKIEVKLVTKFLGNCIPYNFRLKKI